ncbi:armadillo-type protein [Crucibulum laeve]|uniref:Armadillo-type protein n=1 Tax=Crucibulum laeve TaxID=68775 RepID=A0A5C3MK97_9AGAR|nr:armadillo-type protein [Crucibulum laeve]
MHALSQRETSEWLEIIDIVSWTKKGTAKWGWSPDVLAGLVVLGKARYVIIPVPYRPCAHNHLFSPTTVQTISFQDIYPSLQEALLSHSRPVRLNALRLLDSKLVQTADGPDEVLKRCLQGEEVSLDVQGIRERVLRIGRVGQVVGDGSGADLCARWLMAQLKVNLRPLWSPAAAALASLSQRFGDLVWSLIIKDLQALSRGEHAQSSPQWMETGQESGHSESDPWEEERSWRDPSAHKIRSAVQEWEDATSAMIQLLKAQNSRERFDFHSYEFQLLGTLGECPSLAEKHNRELVPHFLSLAGPDAASKLPKHKLNAWLTFFSKFNNPKALYSTDTLRNLYISLLSHPDRSLQTSALNCLFTYKSPHLSTHEDKIRALLDDTRWRDELTTLDIGNLEPQDRHEAIDVILRLLYGVMLEKKGRTRGADRRAAVLSAIAGCTDEELGLLVDLMLGPLGSDRNSRAGVPFEAQIPDSSVSDKQLTGYLTLLGDVLKNLGSRLVRYWPSLLGSTIDVLYYAQSRIDTAMQEDGDAGQQDEETDEAEIPNDASSSRVLRSIRQLGLKRFADFFRSPVIFDFNPYMGSAFTAFISPRLPYLDRENTQAPSALLELFYVWTVEISHIRFLEEYDHSTLPKLYGCLVATSVKPAVILRIFDIVDNLLGHSSIDESIRENVLKPHVSLLLSNLATLVERTKGVTAIATPLGQRQISILSEIARYSTNSIQASTLLGLFSPLLRRPAKLVPEKVKVDLIKIMGDLIQLIPDLVDSSSSTYQKTYALLSQLFQSLRSRPARLSLVSTFLRLATINVSLGQLAELLESMNAYSTKRIDEPDFDRRLAAFATLNETLYSSLPAPHWLPVLYNALHFIQDPVELAVRNNASYAMRHFIDFVAAQTSGEYETTFLRVLFPGLKNGLRSKNEMVRSEVLSVIAYAVDKCTFINDLREMQVLLEGGDEEANFFNNILHVQIHRRSRALRRLGDHCDEGSLRSSTLAEIFVPLVGNYIVSATAVDHHLVNDAILTTGRMAKHLAWGAYYALVQKYLKLSRAKDESERVYVRTLVSLLDNFHFPMEEVIPETEVVNEDADLEDEDIVETPGIVQKPSNTTRIIDAVNSRLLPNLLNHLEKHDKHDVTDDNTRIPIAIGIVTVAKHLPKATREPQITRLITILSQILRSKSQETRDLTRDAINRIAVSLGPSYLPSILRELRAALLRGPQLHVLAYVVHSLLVHITTGDHADRFDTLDDCVNDVAYISAEVIFGQSGKDVLAEDFKTKMREVRSSSSKGLDSFQIMANFLTPVKISSLLVPLRAIMHETESVKVMQSVEEVLRRIAVGLNANKHLVPTELLVLCHTLISQNARFLQQTPARRKSTAKSDAIVQVKRQVTVETDHYANNSFRFITFGLDMFNTALRRNRFDFRDASVITRLEPMVVVVGNTLYSTSAPVLLLGLRCVAGMIKAPLKSLEKSLPVLVRQILDIIKQTGNTESEIVQVAFKSLATILRDGPVVQVKEVDLVYLLELLAPDLEEPERQASVFTMLRAIVARKFVVPEIYDVMDKISEIMVTSQSTQVQELCRGVLLQFLLDYPQGKGRLRNQMAFFAKNLSYVYETGRKSVMELLDAVVSKFQVGLVREYADMLFVALVMVVANDDSAKCREMAAHLIQSLYARLDEEHRNVILSHLHSWASQQKQPQLAWVSSQVYGFIVDTSQADIVPYVSSILEDLNTALARSAASIQDDDADETPMEVDFDWQIPYYALTVLSKILRVFPDLAKEDDKVSWNLVVPHLIFPHAWVRTAACRLIGQLFTAVPIGLPSDDFLNDHPLSTEGMQDVAKKLSQQLKSEHLDESLSLQVVKNLFYIGKCFYLVPVPDSEQTAEDVEDILDEQANPDRELEKGKQKEKEKPKGLNPLPWIFSKLSYQIRSAHIGRRKASNNKNWSQQPLAALRWFAAMTSHMEAARLELFLVHILTPVYRLTEDDTIRDPQMDELKAIAIELQELVQAKVGTTKFSATYNQIRQSVLGVRRERKVARVMQATTNPEAAAKRKQQRNIVKKDSRKRKDRGFADGKGKVKRRREE